MIAPVMIAWVLHTAIGCGRQMYDTGLYTEVYNTIVTDTVLRQRQLGIEPTKVVARSAMSREFVTFFEKDMPVVLNRMVSIIGSAAILFFHDLVIGAVTALLFIPVAIINHRYMRRSLMLNQGLNNQLEQEVQVIEAAQEGPVTHRTCGYEIVEQVSDSRGGVPVPLQRVTAPSFGPGSIHPLQLHSGTGPTAHDAFDPSRTRGFSPTHDRPGGDRNAQRTGDRPGMLAASASC